MSTDKKTASLRVRAFERLGLPQRFGFRSLATDTEVGTDDNDQETSSQETVKPVAPAPKKHIVVTLPEDYQIPEKDWSSYTAHEKKPMKVQPEGTFDYEVSVADTLESIAAQFDTTPSEVCKVNKLVSRLIFPGQSLYIPDKDYVKAPVISTSPPKTQEDEKPKLDVPLVKLADKPPSKVPGHVERRISPVTEQSIPRKMSLDETKTLDQECLERFIKITVKYITDGQGVVSGVLIVTPNAVMFDPNVSDPLVLEHGAEIYGMIAPLDVVISAAMYHDIAAMRIKGQTEDERSLTPKHEIYHGNDCPMSGSHENNTSEENADFELLNTSDVGSVCSCGLEQSDDKSDSKTHSHDRTVHKSSTTDISKTENNNSNISNKDTATTCHPNSIIENGLLDVDIVADLLSETISQIEDNDDKDKTVPDSFTTPHDSCSEKVNSATNVADTSVHSEGSSKNSTSDVIDSKDSKTDLQETNDSEKRIGNIFYMPIEEDNNGDFIVKGMSDMTFDDSNKGDTSSTKPSDIPVVADSASKPETNTNPFSLSKASPHLNAFVNYTTGLFRSTTDDRLDVKDVSEVNKKEQVPDRKKPDFVKQVSVENVVKLEDKPELFQTFDVTRVTTSDKRKSELIPRPATVYEDPPLYLCLRLGKPINKEISGTCPFEAYGKKNLKREYWFSIPRDKVDQLYAFFVQWSPEIYGDEDELTPEKRGFVVINDDDEDNPDGLKILENFFGAHDRIHKDWEIVSAKLAERRRSIEIEEPIPLPELIGETFLKEIHIEKIAEVLPPRSIGYPWTSIYTTEEHGFSLSRLYRHMQGVDSPILLIVRDTDDVLFGALTSCALKRSDHFYGTGESFLFTFYPEFKVFRWTGENNFFIKTNQDSLAIGAGKGLFGVWLDSDLYHGRTHRCDTYDNDILTVSEDFVVKGLEAWGFV